MKVILLENVRGLGKLGETVEVKAGYGRNYLIPYDKAISATAGNLKMVEERRAELEKAAFEKLSDAQKRSESLKDLTLTIKARAMDEGKLFGSVSVREIIDALKEKNVDVQKQEISMPTGPIHEVGEYQIDILLHSELTAPIKVIVEAE